MSRIALVVSLLAAAMPAAADEPTSVAATTYFRTFSHAHSVLKRIRPGEAVATKTVDSAGLDEMDVKRSEPFNPLTGPFFVEGAEPGDALVVRLNKVRLNRDWGWSAYRLGLFSLTPEVVEHIYPNDVHPDLVIKGRSTIVPWDLDRKANTVRLRTPKSQAHKLEFPARPMLGCIGVAPAGDFAPTSGPSGPYGGNLDYNKIGEGATVYLPVYHPGGLLFVGDGHALQADGEPTGTGIETSMDVEFVVELKKGAKLTGPRVETADEIISIGSQPEFASALDNGLKMATSDMAAWLAKDYGMEPWAAHLLIGYQGRYDVVTVAGSMALCLTKSRLPKKVEAPAEKASANATDAPGPIAAKTKGLRKVNGFVPLYWDEAQGKLWMEVARFDREFLYQVALASGLGSNPVGLDRGQLGDSRVVTFRRAGPKVLMVESNYRYRALTDREAERRAVDESFAQSVHWGFKVEAEEGGRVLVDATAFFLRDAHGVADRLRMTKQGAYKLDDSRSALDAGRTKGFPKNTEVEALLTFSADGETGRLVAETAPSPRAVSVRQRHSLVELPPIDSGFTPRRADPRIGVFTVDFYDFATPVTEPVERQYLARHRLIKKDPKADLSEPVAPIVYYVDPGAPEPVRSALVEGASWWARAFEAAGFKDAFKVEVLPDDADPMDLRYNVIQWVHRSTRGWSYGSSVIDPRTGEVIKGRVTLDSLRARQDALIGAGLTTGEPPPGACAAGAGPGAEHLAGLDPSAEPSAMVLARVRQLSAHEVGHTLGLAHNFAASACGRASVMDYPAPLVKIRDDRTLDLSDAYARGVGAYDLIAIRYAYAQFPPGGDEAKELREIVRKGIADGLLFLSDADARPAGAAHPLANLWDNGDDPIAALRHEMKVRAIGLERFGLDRLPAGAPLSDLEARLLPLYLHHRYQLQAAVKTLGGVRYTYAVKEDGGAVRPSPVAAVEPADRQWQAMLAVLETLDPSTLMLPDRLLAMIPPQAFNRPEGTAERFQGRTGLVFDPVAAAVTVADLAVGALLNPERAARLIEFHARDPKNPGFDQVVNALVKKTWEEGPRQGRERAVERAVQWLVVNRLIGLASDDRADPRVRAVAAHALEKLAREDLPPGPAGIESDDWAIAHEIRRFLNRPDATHRRDELPPARPATRSAGAETRIRLHPRRDIAIMAGEGAAETWYVRARGRVLGPLTWEQLQVLRQRGQVARFDQVSRDRQDWVAADSLERLFPRGGAGGAFVGGTGARKPGTKRPGDLESDEFLILDDEDGGGAAPGPAARAGTSADEPAGWYYAEAGTPQGPVGYGELRRLARDGRICPSTLYWRSGLEQWTIGSDLHELGRLWPDEDASRAGPAAATLPPRDRKPEPAGADSPPRVRPLAIASLALNLLCGVGNIAAIVAGVMALRRIARSSGTMTEKRLAIGGILLGIVGVIGSAMAFVWFLGRSTE